MSWILNICRIRAWCPSSAPSIHHNCAHQDAVRALRVAVMEMTRLVRVAGQHADPAFLKLDRGDGIRKDERGEKEDFKGLAEKGETLPKAISEEEMKFKVKRKYFLSAS